MRSFAALLVAVILGAAPPGQGLTAPAGRLPPGPVVVESAPEAPAGLVRIEPGVAHLRVGPDESVQPELVVVNGAAAPLDLALTLAPVAPGPDGAPTLARPTEDARSMVASASTWVALPTSDLHLDPGELARLRPTVSVPALADPGGYVAAVHAATRPRALDASPGNAGLVAFLFVEVPGIVGAAGRRVAPVAALTQSGLAGARGRVRLSTEEAELVAGRLEVDGWWGATLVDVAIPPTLVLPAATRTQTVGFRAPLLPGPYRLTASLETSGGETLTAGVTTWLWNPLTTLLVVLIALVGAAGVSTRTALRRGW